MSSIQQHSHMVCWSGIAFRRYWSAPGVGYLIKTFILAVCTVLETSVDTNVDTRLRPTYQTNTGINVNHIHSQPLLSSIGVPCLVPYCKFDMVSPRTNYSRSDLYTESTPTKMWGCLILTKILVAFPTMSNSYTEFTPSKMWHYLFWTKTLVTFPTMSGLSQLELPYLILMCNI